VEVAYALPDRQELIPLEVEAGTTALEAIERSGLALRQPDIELSAGRVGVFGTLVALDTPLHDGDRVEVYRPLPGDPKEARRLRARQSPRRVRGK